MRAPIETEPVHVALDGVDIFLGFLGRVGVVVAQIAMAAELVGDAEIEANRLGVADMQVAVRLRRKTRDDAFLPPRKQVFLDDITDEIRSRATLRRPLLSYLVKQPGINAARAMASDDPFSVFQI